MAFSVDDFLKPSQNLSERFAKLENKYSSGDDRYWKLETDKAGNGFAIIRFLPAPEGEDDHFVRIFDHGFKGPTGIYYIEKSLSTIEQPDPLGEYNNMLWNRGDDEGKEQARKQKRRTYYHSNIYVVKDPANPKNEGKVFLYQYGKKILDKIKDAAIPQFEGEEQMDAFNPFIGADFRLKAQQVSGYRNYDKSDFAPSGPMRDPQGNEIDKDRFIELWSKCHSLQKLVAPENFKSYDELQKRLYKVLGLDGSAPAAPLSTFKVDEGVEMPRQQTSAQPNAAPSTPSPLDNVSYDENDDDAIDFFKSLADD